MGCGASVSAEHSLAGADIYSQLADCKTPLVCLSCPFLLSFLIQWVWLFSSQHSIHLGSSLTLSIPTFRLSASSSACNCILSCSPHGTLCNSLYSVPLSLPLCCLYSPPLSVLIICYGTLILQGNSHWFPFLSCPALICYATAVPLPRLIGHCPLSFQLPSLLLPFSLNLVPLHHPPPVVWSHTLAVRDLLLTTVSEWGVFHLQSLYQSRTPAACIIRRMHESTGVSFVHIFSQRELFSRC